MAIEIKELVVRLRVTEMNKNLTPNVDVQSLNKQLKMQIKSEVEEQLKRLKER